MAELILADSGDTVVFGAWKPDPTAQPVTLLVFDDVISDTASQYTPTRFNRELAEGERYVIQAICDDVTGTSPTITIVYEHSADGRTFIAKNGGIGEINTASLAVGATTNLRSTGFSSGARAGHGMARLRLALGGTSPKAHVKVWVTLRPYA